MSSYNYSPLDQGQVIKNVHNVDAQALNVIGVGGSLVPQEYNNIALTYVASGNGAGEISTVTYSLDGNPVAVLTLTYDSSNNLINVQRS